MKTENSNTKNSAGGSALLPADAVAWKPFIKFLIKWVLPVVLFMVLIPTLQKAAAKGIYKPTKKGLFVFAVYNVLQIAFIALMTWFAVFMLLTEFGKRA